MKLSRSLVSSGSLISLPALRVPLAPNRERTQETLRPRANRRSLRYYFCDANKLPPPQLRPAFIENKSEVSLVVYRCARSTDAQPNASKFSDLVGARDRN